MQAKCKELQDLDILPAFLLNEDVRSLLPKKILVVVITFSPLMVGIAILY